MQPGQTLELNAMLEQLFARNAALEVMQCQIVLMLAGLTDDPAASARMTMADVTTNLARAQERATKAGQIGEARIMGLALQYANDLTEQMVATKRHKGHGTAQ